MAGGGGDGGEYEVNINLTALLDVLTNLLFFLMFGFAAQQVNMELEGGLELPSSTAETQPVKTVTVSIGTKDLRVEKEPIAQLRNGRLVGVPDGTSRIEPLYRRLIALKNEKNNASLDLADIIFVLCDKNAPYALLHRVMNTAAEAGFPKFRMAVLME